MVLRLSLSSIVTEPPLNELRMLSGVESGDNETGMPRLESNVSMTDEWNVDSSCFK